MSLLDSGDAAGFVYYVMPYIEGDSLRDRLTREGPLPIDEALRLIGGVAGALEYAHGRGVIHRDIKPENILLYQGEAMVADFGVALATASSDPGGKQDAGAGPGHWRTAYGGRLRQVTRNPG